MRSTAYGTNNSSKAITIILCLCIVAAAIWAATSDSAGGYISEKFFKPLFSKTENLTSAPAASSTPAVSENISNSNAGMITVQLDYSARTIYAIQIGAFSSYENAKAGAKDAIVYGAAGYIITKDGFHKLYTSAYTNEGDAQSKKTQLLAQGIDACMARIEIDGVQLNITATQDQIDTISSAHNTWINSGISLFELSDKLEKKQVNTAKAITTAKSIHAEIQTDLIELNKYKDMNNVTQNLYEQLELCDTQLSSFLSASLSDAEVSSSIKYLMMDFIYRFGQYANEISA